MHCARLCKKLFRCGWMNGVVNPNVLGRPNFWVNWI